jgi:hypothetical protein
MRSRTAIVRRVVLAVAMSAVVALAGMQLGCARSQAMHSGSGVPASEGTVTATVGDNGNTNVSVRVKHLAPPANVEPDATVYVVWIQAENASKQSVGALVPDDDLEGRLDTVTPHQRFLVSVTPEPNGHVAYPTHAPVFTSNVERPQ